MGWSSCSEVFNLVRASLSQKLKRPSEPTVASVPWTGWKEIAFTWWDNKGDKLVISVTAAWICNYVIFKTTMTQVGKWKRNKRKRQGEGMKDRLWKMTLHAHSKRKTGSLKLNPEPNKTPLTDLSHSSWNVSKETLVSFISGLLAFIFFFQVLEHCSFPQTAW